MDSNFEPLLLSSQELLDKYWNAAAPLLTKCVENSMKGEVELIDIYNAALKGQAFVFVLVDKEDNLGLVALMEVALYPHLPSLNIVGVAGKNLRALAKKFLPFLYGWAYMSGARSIEANVPPALERLLGEFGFNRTSIHVRRNLSP